MQVESTAAPFFRQKHGDGKCALTSLYNACGGSKIALSVSLGDCNGSRAHLEQLAKAAGRSFGPGTFGLGKSFHSMETLIHAAREKGFLIRRAELSATLGDIKLRHKIISEYSCMHPDIGMMVLLGHSKHKYGTKHVIAIRNGIVFDGEMETPIPIAEYSRLRHACRVYALPF